MECAFGEIDLWWGILWKKVEYSLELNCAIIDDCMRLHNFIDDHCNRSNGLDEIDREVFSDDSHRFNAVNPYISEGVSGGEKNDHLDKDGNLYCHGS